MSPVPRRISSLLLHTGAALLVGIAGAALIGWTIGPPWLTGWRDNLLPMAPLTALLFVLLGVAVELTSREPLSRVRQRSLQGILVFVGVVAGGVIVLRLSGGLLRIEHLGLDIRGAINGAPIGYAAWPTALGILLGAVGLCVRLRTGGGTWLSLWWLVATGAVVGGGGIGLSLTNLVSGEILLSGARIAPALNTSVCLVVLGLTLFVLASRSLWAATHPSGRGLTRLYLGALFAVLTTATMVGGYATYSQEAVEIRDGAERELQTIGQLRLREVALWRRERAWDGGQFFRNHEFSGVVSQFLHRDQAAGRTHLRGWIERFPRGDEYDLVVLLDAGGTARLSIPESDLAPDAIAALGDAARAAARSGEIMWRDFYWDADRHRPALDLLIPVEGADNQTLAVLALRIDPAASLFSIFRGWPSPSQTAETLLVRADGPDVLFLTPLRFDPEAAVRRRLPSVRAPELAARAVRGETGVLDGEDYRGLPAVGFVQAVPESPWFMVNRIGVAELQMELRQRLWLIASFVLVMVAALGTSLGWIWRHQQSQSDAEQLALSAALKDSEERLRLAMRAANHGLWDFNVLSGQVVVSEEYARILGFDPVTFTESREMWVARLHPDDRAATVAALTDYLEGRRAEYHAEFREAAHDNTYRWLLSSGRLVSRTIDGRPCRMLGTITDIGDRKLAELALRHSEEALRATTGQLRSLLDNSPTVIYTMARRDGALAVVDVTANIERIFGFSYDDALQAGWWTSHLVAEDRVTAPRAIAALSDHDDITHEFRILKKDGTVCWVQDSLHVTERTAGTVIHLVGAWMDVTARKQAELRARRLSQLYATLSDCNAAMVKSTTEAALFDSVCRAAVAHGAMSMAWLGLVDEHTGAVVNVASHGTGRDYADALHITVRADDPFGQGPTGTAIRENRAVWTEDFPHAPHTAPWHASARRYGWQVSGSLPLTRRGRVIGALTICSVEAREIDAESRALLTEMVANVSFALDSLASEAERSDAESRLRESEARYRTIFEESSLPMMLIDPDTRVVRDANGAAQAFYGWSLAELRGMPVTNYSLTADEIQERVAPVPSDGQRRFAVQHRLASGELRDVEVYSGVVTTGGQRLLQNTIIDVTARRQMEAAVQVSLHEKEILLREVHHRVKNNLQLITSLLRLESGRADDAAVRLVLAEMQGRIMSMALLHETLYRSGTLTQIDLGQYLEQLSGQLFRSFAPPTGVTLRLALSPAFVELEQAHPCGLLVNELLSNALKHGFTDGRTGDVSVRLETVGAALRLEVSDTGVGLPADFKARSAHSLGLHLVSLLTAQLQGTLEIGEGPGARFAVVFTPKPPVVTPHADGPRAAAES